MSKFVPCILNSSIERKEREEKLAHLLFENKKFNFFVPSLYVVTENRRNLFSVHWVFAKLESVVSLRVSKMRGRIQKILKSFFDTSFYQIEIDKMEI